MKIEVRATGLREMRRRRGLTQRKLASELSISINYIPAIEANDRQAGPKLQQKLMKYFGCPFDALFQIVLIDPETRQEQVLQARRTA